VHARFVLFLQDFFQLLQKNLMILKAPKKNALNEELRGGYQVYTAGHFEREFALKPSQWVDYLALVGDTAGGWSSLEWPRFGRFGKPAEG